jgi:hypothetical protein
VSGKISFAREHLDLPDTKAKYGVAFPSSSTFRTSRCTRFMAVRSEWELPRRTEWTLLDTVTSRAHKVFDFASCAERAQEIMDKEGKS